MSKRRQYTTAKLVSISISTLGALSPVLLCMIKESNLYIPIILYGHLVR